MMITPVRHDEPSATAGTVREQDRFPVVSEVPVQRPALVFDGDCSFCSRCAGLARRILPADCSVVPWQEVDLATAGFTADRARTEVIWVDRDGGPGRGCSRCPS